MKKTLIVDQSSIDKWQDLAGEELYAHLLYTQIAANLQAAGLFGAQKLFEHEADQELSHYKKVRDIVNNLGGLIFPTSSYKITEKAATIGEALAIALKTEVDLLNKYKDAKNFFSQSDDQASYQAVLEFIEKQRKSVGELTDLLIRYELVKDNGAGVLLFDQELGK